MTPWEFRQLFLYKLWLIPTTTPDPVGFKEYMQHVSILRSGLIHKLRLLQYPGYVRARYNNSINHFVPDYRQYLYKINRNCALCGYVMASLSEATRDHIQERGRGGQRGIINQQLAHGHCNVLKSADYNKTTGQHSRPRRHLKRTKVLH